VHHTAKSVGRQAAVGPAPSANFFSLPRLRSDPRPGKHILRPPTAVRTRTVPRPGPALVLTPGGCTVAAINPKLLLGKLNAPSRRALEAAAGLCLSRTNFNV